MVINKQGEKIMHISKRVRQAKKSDRPKKKAVKTTSKAATVMRYYVGLDVAIKRTQICILDETGKIIVETSALSRPELIEKVLRQNCGSAVDRIGIESGNFSGWLCQELKNNGWPIVCLDALQVSRFLSVRRNKTDANDARGLAELVRHGLDWIQEVHVKSISCYQMRNLLVIRNRIVRQRVENELMIRGMLKTYGGLIQCKGDSEGFRERAIEAMEAIASRRQIDLGSRLSPILDLIDDLRERADDMEEELRDLAEAEPICQRFMKIPGVGPIVALSFFTAIEDPTRFSRSQDVGAYFGLTPRIYQSGEMDSKGQISHMGNTMTRTHLVQAANCILCNTRTWTTLKAWGVRLAKKIGYNKAKVAVARKLAILMFAMWRDDTPFRYGQEALQGDNL